MIQDPPSWVNRPAIVAGVAFLIGAVVAGVVVAVILTRGDDNSGSSVARRVTATPAATSAATVAGTTPPAVSLTPLNPRKPDDALAAYVQDQMRQRYIGPCPNSPAANVPVGVCSNELYRSAELLTVTIRPSNGAEAGELVLTPGQNGVWSAVFVAQTNRPPAIGAAAVVYGAGDCLNFHAGPSKASQTLSCQQDGNRADVVGGPQTADGITWWQLKDLGWASQEFLEAAP